MTSICRWLCITALGAAVAAGPAAAAVGKFVYIDGAVSVRNAAGIVRAAARGEGVDLQETIITGEGRAQLRFDDGGWISLQPRTVFEVKEYEWRQDGKIVISLLKGTARAVTGFLSQGRPYNFTTPVATIGIRGTSFQVSYCLQSCDVPDGLYVTGGDGTVFVRNGFGEIDLSRGRTAYVATAQTPPRESSVKPVTDMKDQMSQQQLAAAGSTSTSELRPGNFLYFQGSNGYVGPFTITSPRAIGLGLAISGSGSADATGLIDGVFKTQTGSAIGGAASAGGSTSLATGTTMTLVLDGLNRPVSFTLADATGRISGTALRAPDVFGGDGALFWGRWNNMQFQGDAQDTRTNATGTATLNPNAYVHYITGIPSASVPASGTATYSFAGGTGSTSAAGVVGAGVTGGSLTANFGSNSISTSLAISHGGNWTAGGSGTIDPGNRSAFNGVTGSASGPGGTVPFKFDGFFSGAGAPTAPQSAGMSWQIKAPDAFVGTAGFRCSSGC